MKCGIAMGLSVLQNAITPQFLFQEILQELVDAQNHFPCVLKPQEGLRMVGVYKIVSTPKV